MMRRPPVGGISRPGRPTSGSFGPIVVLYMLPFAAAMVLLAARIWRGATVPDDRSPTLEPVTVPAA
jgi:hypothetical protein